MSDLEKDVLKDASELIDASADEADVPSEYQDDGPKENSFREKLRDLAACLKHTTKWPL